MYLLKILVCYLGLGACGECLSRQSQCPYLSMRGRVCGLLNVKLVSPGYCSAQLQKYPNLSISRVFMLTHGKEVRRVSFLLTVLKAFPALGLRVVGKVSFPVRTGYFLTFIDVKY